MEIFGTEISRIKQLYEDGLRKPDFEVTENTITIRLPVLEENLNLTEDEREVYQTLSKKGVIVIEGKGRGTVRR